jgi:hypothetical protein
MKTVLLILLGLALVFATLLAIACCKVAGDSSREEERRHGN